MSVVQDPFEMLVVEENPDDFAALSRKPVAPTPPPATAPPGAVTGRFHSFDLSDQPLISGVPGLPGEVIAARSTVPLLRDQIGSTVVVLFEQADPRRPIIVGVLQDRTDAVASSDHNQVVSVQADDDRLLLSAEREIVLRCGDASVTLTRAGKVLIKGTYILSRSSGHNKIKGAAVDIN
jgi:hypothetical protein